MPREDKMSEAEVDRILSKPDEIQPSSGFVASVMESVRREAAAPPPIPFPWRRALPVLALGATTVVLVLGLGVAAIVQLTREPLAAQIPQTSWFSVLHGEMFHGQTGAAVGWTALGLLAAFLSVKLSMRLIGGRT